MKELHVLYTVLDREAEQRSGRGRGRDRQRKRQAEAGRDRDRQEDPRADGSSRVKQGPAISH